MPLQIPHKIDGDPTNAGIHFSSELNHLVNTINEPLAAYGEQDPNSQTNQLAAAFAAAQCNIIYEGIMDASGRNNKLTLKSLTSNYLLKQIGLNCFFRVDKANTGAVTLFITPNVVYGLTKGGSALRGGELKPGFVYSVTGNGVVMNMGVQNPLTFNPVPTTNINSLIDIGVYPIVNPDINNGAPTLSSGTVLLLPVAPSNGIYLQQYIASDGITYIRYFDGTKYTPWVNTTAAGTSVGSLLITAAITEPDGYLLADGSELNKVLYSDLYAVIGDAYNTVEYYIKLLVYKVGDKVTSTIDGAIYICTVGGVNGLDPATGGGTGALWRLGDNFMIPDMRGEFIRGLDNGRGIDIGRTLGSLQLDTLKSHNHAFTVYGGNDINFGLLPLGTDDAPFGSNVVGTANTGGSETRPRNLAFNICIKY